MTRISCPPIHRSISTPSFILAIVSQVIHFHQHPTHTISGLNGRTPATPRLLLWHWLRGRSAQIRNQRKLPSFPPPWLARKWGSNWGNEESSEKKIIRERGGWLDIKTLYSRVTEFHLSSMDCVCEVIFQPWALLLHEKCPPLCGALEKSPLRSFSHHLSIDSALHPLCFSATLHPHLKPSSCLPDHWLPQQIEWGYRRRCEGNKPFLGGQRMGFSERSTQWFFRKRKWRRRICFAWYWKCRCCQAS